MWIEHPWQRKNSKVKLWSGIKMLFKAEMFSSSVDLDSDKPFPLYYFVI